VKIMSGIRLALVALLALPHAIRSRGLEQPAGA